MHRGRRASQSPVLQYPFRALADHHSALRSLLFFGQLVLELAQHFLEGAFLVLQLVHEELVRTPLARHALLELRTALDAFGHSHQMRRERALPENLFLVLLVHQLQLVFSPLLEPYESV